MGLFNYQQMKYNYKLVQKIVTNEQVDELLRYISEKNGLKYSLSKAAEEFNELALICLQYSNKIGEHQPTHQEVVDEIGDALMRIQMITTKLNICEHDIRERVLHKANKYLGYLKKGEYKGGI